MFKKTVIAFSVVVLALFAYVSDAFSWSAATHTYIDDRLNRRGGLNNLDEIYGGIAPDVFNYLFDYPAYLGYLYYETHNDFVAPWEEAKSRRAKAFAYGFVSHNDVWGADYTAHHSGITFGQEEGYVITKARTLLEILEEVPEFNSLGMPDEVKLEIAHEIVENGVDILVKRLDPGVGQKVATSAARRSPEFPLLLVRAYAPGFSEYAGISYAEAAGLITSAEREFRRNMVLYGYVLMQDEGTAVMLLSEEMASLAVSYLSVYGITLPEGVDLVPLIEFAVGQAMELCETDYAWEIQATIDHVDGELRARGIYY
jgi:hypothetical protein